MADLFISYSRKDTEFVRILDAALVRSKYDTWVDWQNIPPTADWWEEIQSGIESAHTFIFILSPHSVGSKVCRQEIDHAVKHNKRLIPIVRRDVNAEDVHPALGKINWIHFRKKDDFQAKFQDLVKSIDIDLKYWKTHTTLLTQAIGWDKNNRDSGLLLRGRVLTEAAQWLIQSNFAKEPRPTQTQIDYVSASVDARRATNKQQRITIGILGTLLAMSAMLSVLAFSLYGRANSARKEAENARKSEQAATSEILKLYDIANYQKIVTRARQFKQQEFDKGVLLATAAMKGLKSNGASTGEASHVLYDRLKLLPPQESVVTHGDAVQEAIFSPEGRYLATLSSDNTVILWDRQENQEVSRWSSEEGLKEIMFSPKNDQYFLVRSTSHRPILWDLQENKKVERFNVSGTLKEIIFSPNGQYLATLSESKIAILWNLQTSQKIKEFNSQKTIEKIIFSPKAQYLTVLRSGNNVTLWNLNTKKERKFSYYGTAHDVRFSPDDGFFAYRVSDKEIWVQSLTENRHSKISHEGDVEDIRFSPNSPYVANRQTNEIARVWDLQKNRNTSIIHQGKVDGLSFSPDGRFLAISSQNNKAIVWDLSKEEKINEITHDNKVVDLQFSPNNRYLATRSEEAKSIRVWNLGANEEAARIAHEGNIRDFSFSNDGNYLATGSSDNTAKVWDLNNNREVARITHQGAIVDLNFSPDDRHIVTGSRDNTARVWDLKSPSKISQVVRKNGELKDMSFSTDGKYLAAASDNKTVKIWDIQSNEELATLPHEVDINAVSFSPKGDYLMTSGSDNKVRIWNWQKQQEPTSTINQPSALTAMAFSNQGKYLAVGGETNKNGSEENTAVVWDLTTNQQIASLTHEGKINDLSFSPDDQYLATGSDDKTARIWNLTMDLETSEPVRIRHEGPVNAVSFSNDGNYLATGSADKTTKVWDIEAGEELDLILHDDAVTDVSFGNNDRYLATGSADNTARVWDLTIALEKQDFNQAQQEWEQQQILEIVRVPHENIVDSVNLHPDGDKLLTQSGNTAQVLSVDVDNLIAEACSRLPHNLTESEWEDFFRDEPYRETCPK